MHKFVSGSIRHRGFFEVSWLDQDAVQEFLKRSFDIVVASILLITFAPIMLVSAAVILFKDGAPIFFIHDRIGRDGRKFGCCKFRTMVRNSEEVLDTVLAKDPERRAEWRASQKLTDDPRILGQLGRFLRKTSLDEIPQLFNVLRGEMSMVGPRPITKAELPKYGDAAAKYLSVRPGLTGAWQVGGRSATTYEQRVAIDVRYIDNWSLMGDLKIVAQTVKVVLGDRNAA